MALEIRSIPVLTGENAAHILSYMEEEASALPPVTITDEMWKAYEKLEARSREFNYKEWKENSH